MQNLERRLEMIKRTICIGILLALLGLSNITYAALQNNGNGLIYDTDLNITWYDYSHTGVNWNQALNWAATLSVTDKYGRVYNTGWRLPKAVDGPYVYVYDGTTTAGYNITSSELGHLFYTELGNKGIYDKNGIPQEGFGLINEGPFTNLIHSSQTLYWSCTEYTLNSDFAWIFGFDSNPYIGSNPYSGLQGTQQKWSWHFALAVHDGNVGANVPIPAAVWLLGSGLIGLDGIRKRIQN